LKLPRSNAAMQIVAFLVVGLAAANKELVLLNRDVELVARETGNGKRNPQPFRLRVGPRNALDIVGRVALCRRFGDAAQRALDLVEAEQEG